MQRLHKNQQIFPNLAKFNEILISDCHSMSMRILIIEDDALLSSGLRRGLKSLFAVDTTNTGLDGLHKAEQVNYDAILLDLNLPDISGKEVCFKLRRHGLTTPIIILTGSNQLENKVSLLDMGADDYVTKPFNLNEVTARLRAVMRRNRHVPCAKELVVGDLVLDPVGRTLTHKDKHVDLRRKEFDLFEYMMCHAGQTLTRAMILEHVWDMNEDLWANVVDVHIKHLRDKIDRPFGTHVIRTIHGIGYKLDIER